MSDATFSALMRLLDEPAFVAVAVVLVVIVLVGAWEFALRGLERIAKNDASPLQSPYDPEQLQAEREAQDARTSVRGALAPMDDSEVSIAEARHRAWM